MEYGNDYVMRLIEQMGALVRRAFTRFREDGAVSEPLELTDAAIGMVTNMDASLFLRLSPLSMVSMVEISGYDDRVVVALAEALELQAEIYESEGSLIEAGVRRDQASALLESLDPSHAN